LVVPEGDGDDQGRIRYRLTEAGAKSAATWWVTPVIREPAPRSEVAIKLALAVSSPGVDVTSVVQVQRRSAIGHLQDLTRLNWTPSTQAADVAWGLVLDHLIFTTESEVRWLDHVEARLASSGVRATTKPADDAALTAHHMQEQR
jgi:hypothetical protein